MNNSFETQKNQFNFVQKLLNKGLDEIEDENFAEECEKDKTATFEQTRGIKC